MIQPVQNHDFAGVYIDIESGGFSPKQNPLLEYGWGFLNQDYTIESGDSICILPQAGKVIEPTAAMINGYSEDRWAERGAIDIDAARARIIELFAPYDSIIAFAHNAPFDKNWTEEYIPEIMPKIREWQCTQKWLRRYCNANGIPIEKGTLKLENGCKLAGYRQVDRHGALEDCFSGAGLTRFLVSSGVPYRDN